MTRVVEGVLIIVIGLGIALLAAALLTGTSHIYLAVIGIVAFAWCEGFLMTDYWRRE